jgi:xylulokinase
VLIDEGQAIRAEATAPLEVSRPHDGWSEQDPASWLAAADRVMRELGPGRTCRASAGIGLSGQMHGATLLDAAHEVLRPCILWNDTRSHREAAELDADPRFRAVTGNIVFPGFTAPKLAWVRNHEPEVFARVALVLLPKDYLRLWLTGEAVAEMSDAAGTSWLDTGQAGLGRRAAGGTHLARATCRGWWRGPRFGDAARRPGGQWGLPKGVVVAGGGGRQRGLGRGRGAW